MNPSLHNFRESLLQRLLDFLWRQATRNPHGAELIESLLADLETILPEHSAMPKRIHKSALRG